MRLPPSSTSPFRRRPIVVAMRIALLALTTAGVPSCIIGPPQELTEAEQVSPIPYLDQVVPPLNAPVEFKSSLGDAFSFTVPFASEDLGEDVKGRLYLNWGTDDVVILADGKEGPGQLSDQTRDMTIPFARAPKTPGCYTVTMIITYLSNLEDFDTLIDSKKAAVISWIVAVDTPFHELTLADCPAPFESP